MHGPGIQPSGQDSSFGPCPDMVSDGRGAECSVLVIGDASAGGGRWGSVFRYKFISIGSRASFEHARAMIDEPRADRDEFISKIDPHHPPPAGASPMTSTEHSAPRPSETMSGHGPKLES